MRAVRSILGAVLVLLLAAGAAAQAPEPVGQVVRQQGAGPQAVVVMRLGQTSALALGAPVFAADHIRTDATGRVVIEFADGAMLTVGPDSELVLADYVAPPGGGGWRTALSLLLGIVRTEVPTGGQAEVRTAAAVASARSTVWIVEATPTGTAVLGVEGETAVTGTAVPVTVILTPGLGTDVPNGGPPGPPVRWGEARAASALARTTVP